VRHPARVGVEQPAGVSDLRARQRCLPIVHLGERLLDVQLDRIERVHLI
jgi:hypothetical protein